jgi:hypothetical protein
VFFVKCSPVEILTRANLEDTYDQVSIPGNRKPSLCYHVETGFQFSPDTCPVGIVGCFLSWIRQPKRESDGTCTQFLKRYLEAVTSAWRVVYTPDPFPFSVAA